MISQDTKDQIEKEALKEYPIHYGNYTFQGDYISEGFDANAHNRAAFIRFSTKYAEKLEEKDKEIEKLTEDSRLWKIAHDNCANHFDDLKERLESKDLELAQLKEIAERMAKVIETWNKGGNYDAPNAFTAYAEWCKQNLK